MLSKSQTLVYEALVARLRTITKERRNTDLSSDELQSVMHWIESLKLIDDCKNIPVSPLYESSICINGTTPLQMMTVTSSRTIHKPSKESISKAQEFREMSDEKIIKFARQIGMKL